MASSQTGTLISRDEARQLVHSLPERLQRFSSNGDAPGWQFGAMASVGAGAILTLAAFSSRLPYGLRLASGMGAAFAVGMAAIFAATSRPPAPAAPVSPREFQPFLDALSGNPQMQEELAQHFTQTITRDMVDGHNDWAIIGQACRFGAGKGLLQARERLIPSTPAPSAADCPKEDNNCWRERYQNTGAGQNTTGTGKSVFLAGAN